jgi:hypothetical protein
MLSLFDHIVRPAAPVKGAAERKDERRVGAAILRHGLIDIEVQRTITAGSKLRVEPNSADAVTHIASHVNLERLVEEG